MFFSNLDFDLIILNYHDQPGFKIEEESSDHLLMDATDGLPKTYQDFYWQLLKEGTVQRY